MASIVLDSAWVEAGSHDLRADLSRAMAKLKSEDSFYLVWAWRFGRKKSAFYLRVLNSPRGMEKLSLWFWDTGLEGAASVLAWDDHTEVMVKPEKSE